VVERIFVCASPKADATIDLDSRFFMAFRAGSPQRASDAIRRCVIRAPTGLGVIEGIRYATIRPVARMPICVHCHSALARGADAILDRRATVSSSPARACASAACTNPPLDHAGNGTGRCGKCGLCVPVHRQTKVLIALPCLTPGPTVFLRADGVGELEWRKQTQQARRVYFLRRLVGAFRSR
jgi:hypothetical protein